jgi:hypothetical protein
VPRALPAAVGPGALIIGEVPVVLVFPVMAIFKVQI